MPAHKKPRLPPKPCERCGAIITQRDVESNYYFEGKKYCSRSCSSFSRKYKKRDKKPKTEPVKIINTALYFRRIQL